MGRLSDNCVVCGKSVLMEVNGMYIHPDIEICEDCYKKAMSDEWELKRENGEKIWVKIKV